MFLYRFVKSALFIRKGNNVKNIVQWNGMPIMRVTSVSNAMKSVRIVQAVELRIVVTAKIFVFTM